MASAAGDAPTRRQLQRQLAKLARKAQKGSLAARLRSSTVKDIAVQHHELQLRQRNEARASILTQIPALASLSPAQRNAALACLEEVEYGPDEYIIREGEIGREFFIISRGAVNVLKRDPVGEDRFLVRLGVDRYFGEIALLKHEARTASVVSVGHVSLLRMTRAKFNEILAPVHGTLSEMRREVTERKILTRVPVFQCLTALQRKSLVDKLELAHFGAGDFVCRQGMVGDSFYIITHGSCSISIADKAAPNGQRQVATRGTWEHFGDGSLLEVDAKRGASVVATGDLTCLRLCKYEFLSLLKQLHNQLSAQVVMSDPTLLLAKSKSMRMAEDLHRSPAEMLVEAIRTLNDAKMCGPKRIKSFTRGLLRRLRFDMYSELLDRAEADPSQLERVPVLGSQLLGLPGQMQREKLAQMAEVVLQKSFSARTDEETALVDLITERSAFRAKYCNGWDSQQSQDLCGRMSFLRVPNMTHVFRQDSVGTASYIILSGTVRVWSETTERGVRRRETLADLAPGESFGDLAMLGMTQRGSHALCISPCSLIVLEREDYRRVETQGRAQSAAAGTMPVEDKYALMQRMALFAKMDVYKLYRLAFVVEERSYHKGQVIVAKDDLSPALFFIVRGTVNLELPARAGARPRGQPKTMRIATINEFEFFGESGILHSSARTPTCRERANLVAGTHVLELLVLSPADYKRLDSSIMASLKAQNAQRQAWFVQHTQELKKTRNRVFTKSAGGHLVLRKGEDAARHRRRRRRPASAAAGKHARESKPAHAASRRPRSPERPLQSLRADAGSPPPPLRREGAESPIPGAYRASSPPPQAERLRRQVVVDMPGGGDQPPSYHGGIHESGAGTAPEHWFRSRGWHAPAPAPAEAPAAAAKARPSTAGPSLAAAAVVSEGEDEDEENEVPQEDSADESGGGGAQIFSLRPGGPSALAFGSPYSTLPSVVGPAVVGAHGDGGGPRSARAKAVGLRPLSAFTERSTRRVRTRGGPLASTAPARARPQTAAHRARAHRGESNEDTIKRIQAELAAMNSATAALSGNMSSKKGLARTMD